MSKRLSYVDIAKGIAMLFIVFGHVIVHTPNAYFIYKYIYSFHVVLFFVLSGLTYSNKKPVKEFVIAKFKRLMIPYLILGGLVTSEGNSNTWLQYALEILYGNGNNNAIKQNIPLWFLPALFSSEVIYRSTDEWKIKNKDMIMTISLLFISICSQYLPIVLPWGVNTALALLVFFQSGVLIGKYQVLKRIERNIYLKMYLSILIISTFFTYNLNKTIGCIDYSYGTYILFFYIAMTISVFIIYISYKIGSCKWLEYVGKNTMNILIFHKLFVILFQLNYCNVISPLNMNSLWISMPMAIVATVIATAASLLVGWGLKEVHRRGIKNENISNWIHR